MAGKAVGRRVQAAIAQRQVARDERDPVRVPRGLLLEKAVDRHVERRRGRLRVPVHQKLAALGCAQQWQIGDPPSGIGQGAEQQGLEVPGHAPPRRRIEEVAAQLPEPDP